ncbi:MAG: type II toxin-antitoxin system VapC family toxin [Deltaproteobacteria bacterium]|nr:type II toxin-antitoxin system VapC family toxin [Deltaproteobacteria bacterium]
MQLSAIADNSKVFIDSNIFIYHFSNFERFADSCLSFFRKVEEGKIFAYTSTIVLAEVLHRLMVIEASKKFNAQPKHIVKLLKNNPDKASSLTEHLKSFDLIEKLGVSILPVTAHDLRVSIELKRGHGLLTIDAINVSVMKNNDLTIIASNDSDYSRIAFLTHINP